MAIRQCGYNFITERCPGVRKLLDMSFAELGEYLARLDQPRYRTGQIMRWLCRGAEIKDMTDLPLPLRDRLASECETGLPIVVEKLTSQRDGLLMLLLALSDGQLVESVVMNYEHGKSVCISSQAGCRMGCRFCASTLNGLARNLTAGEILGQVIVAQREIGARIGGVVIMGIGEPFDNYDNVVKFIRLVSAPEGAEHRYTPHLGLYLRNGRRYQKACARGAARYAFGVTSFGGKLGAQPDHANK